MKNFLKFLIAGIVCYAVKDSINRALFDESPAHFVFKAVPGSESEKKFMRIFSQNSKKFKNMRVQLAGVFGTDYNAYLFDIKPRDTYILDGFTIEF